MKIFAKLSYVIKAYFSANLLQNAARFALFATIIPSALMLIYFNYVLQEGDLDQYLFITLVIFFAIFISVIPLFKDFGTLSKYLNSLSLNRNVRIPHLQSTKTLVDLMDSINVLSKSWETKKYALNRQIIESKILFNTIPDIILVVNSDMIIIKNNDQISAIYDKNPYSENIKDVIKNPLVDSGVRLVLSDGAGKQFEITLSVEDFDMHFMVKIESYNLGDDQEKFAVVILQDITEIKRTEKMFADFITNVSHELKTPLSSIIGVVDTLEYTEDFDEEIVKDLLPILNSQSKRMSNLINDLLNLAHVERLQNIPPSDIINVKDLVNVSVKNLEWSVKQAGKQIIVGKCKDLCEIKGDFSQLVQVMENLITNAIKYSYEKSDIKISYGNLDIKKDGLKTGGEKGVYITVSDKGEGIPKEILPRLTERFFRIDKSRSNKTGGTGLGLSIVKHILARHDAQLVVSSKEGVGSEFKIIFSQQ